MPPRTPQLIPNWKINVILKFDINIQQPTCFITIWFFVDIYYVKCCIDFENPFLIFYILINLLLYTFIQ